MQKMREVGKDHTTDSNDGFPVGSRKLRTGTDRERMQQKLDTLSLKEEFGMDYYRILGIPKEAYMGWK